MAATFCATLVDEWAMSGLRHAVISPGSRNTALSVALDADDRIGIHVAHDERVAGFMALGIALATGRPAIVACTSGTAAVHLHAAVVEADLAAVPMLVLTADRPPELHGVFAPQTIDQRELYGRAVRWYCEPGPPAADAAPWWRDLARDALQRAEGGLPGPVHLDLAFREPLTGEAAELPQATGPSQVATPERPGVPWGLTDEDTARLVGTISGRRGVIVAGVRTALDEAEVEAVWALADGLGWPVLADGPSGMRVPRAGLISTFDLLSRVEHFTAAHPPEVVLRIGGLLSSKACARFLGVSTPVQLGIDRFGRCPDPQGDLAAGFAAVPAEAARALLAARPAPAPPAWRRSWERAEESARSAVGLAAARGGGGAGEPTVAMDVVASVPAGGTLVVSSSMPVRDVEWFAPPREDIRIVSNRGANGIDGVTSTAIGVALGSGLPTVLLTGDVAFLHDVGALTGLARRELDLTVVVVDNDGGGIFGFLPQAEALPSERFERLLGTPHGTDLVSVATAFGLPCEGVNSRAGLQAALAGALARGGTRVVVARCERGANVAEHRRFQAAVAAALGV